MVIRGSGIVERRGGDLSCESCISALGCVV